MQSIKGVAEMKRRIDLKIDEDVWGRFSEVCEAVNLSRSSGVEMILRCFLNEEYFEDVRDGFERLRKVSGKRKPD